MTFFKQTETFNLKCITVPKTIDAQKRLDYDECFDVDLVEFNMTNEEYASLDKTEVFTILNEALSINIDEYEDESIFDPVMIHKAKMLVEGMLYSKHSLLLAMLLSQIKKAEESKTGVYFFF